MLVKYLRKTLIFITAIFCVAAALFRGHIFLALDGYMIMKKTPESLTDTITDTSYILYEAVVNGDCMDILLGEDMYLPLKINSGRLGNLEVAVIADLRNGIKRIQDSEAFDLVEQSKYSKRQVNLLYRFFDYYFGENRLLVIPYYGYRERMSFGLTVSSKYRERTAVYLRMFISLGLLIFLWLKCGRIENLMQNKEWKSIQLEASERNVNTSNKKIPWFRYSMLMLMVLLAALYLSFVEVVTLL